MPAAISRRNPIATLAAAALLAIVASALAEAPDARGAPLFEGLGDHHHPISSAVPEAQRYFDQGLILAYAFNHAEAERSFREAARLDPECAICWWGVALVLGPNINLPMGDEAVKPAWEALQNARALTEHASPREADYIRALAHRYTEAPPADRSPLDLAYAEAMREVAAAWPDDLDAKTLLAEALMDTMPWDYWISPDLAKPETKEIMAVLEEVMERNPRHPGALHLYIHAVEASSEPGRGEEAADRLAHLVPGAGHLVHMPAHIYIRVGRYDDAVTANERAAAADEAYIAQCKAQGFYPAMYYPHNIHFLWAAAQFDGRRALAVESAEKLAERVPLEMLGDFPALEEFLPTPYFAWLRFGMWDEILAAPRPPAHQEFTTGMWHYARGTAQVATGDMEAAAASLHALEHAAANEAMAGFELTSGSDAATLLELATHGLRGDLAAARGAFDAAIASHRAAVEIEDSLPYSEPEPWYMPMRQALGKVLLQAGRAAEAEAAYREDLQWHPNNGWSLLGLAQSLEAQGRNEEAAAARAQLDDAWARADVTLAASRF